MNGMLALLLAAQAGVAATAVIDPAELTPGAPGVCLTEMEGGELTEVPLTVLGVLGPTAPEGEIVLVRLEHERFEETGIIAGMSGSPVYVDGRLLGALAFGWSFAKQPIAGVTPFGRMLELRSSAPAAASGAARRPSLADLVSAGRSGGLGELVLDWLVPRSGGGLERLPLAMSLGGWTVPAGAGWLAEGWRRLGWIAVPGGAAGDGAAGGPLRPGAMVAGVMVDGDAVVAAGGTVTEVRGSEVWAFGHSFLGAGDADIPLARARVLAVLPSQAVSFKFFEVGAQIGAIRADRSRGVWGRVGAPAPMVPVEVTVDGRSYRFRSIRHPVMLPLMVGYLTEASLAARGRILGEQTLAAAIELRFADDRRVAIEETFAGDQAPVEGAALAAAAVGYLESSPFAAPEVAAIAVRLASAERIDSATLVAAVPERSTVEPGQTLAVRLRLRPYRGAEYSTRIEIQIPSWLPDGRLDLVAADGGSWSAYDLEMRPLEPSSFAEELRLLARLVPSRRVVVALERREVGVSLPGGTVAAPPGLVIQLRSGLGPNLATAAYGVVGRVDHEMPTAVVGAHRIPLLVRRALLEGS